MTFHPTVDEEKCNGCEECVEICTSDVFEIRNGKSVPINAQGCFGCESCVEVCKEKAITVAETQRELSDTCLSLLRDII